jgi:hypothetical protein
MDRDPFGHRKYHGLYFILGFLIAVVLVLSLGGCEQAKTSAGVDIERPPVYLPGWPPVYCCMALTPSCEACQEGIPEDVWLEKTCGIDAIDAEYAGWDEDKNEPIWLCQIVIIN